MALELFCWKFWLRVGLYQNSELGALGKIRAYFILLILGSLFFFLFPKFPLMSKILFSYSPSSLFFFFFNKLGCIASGSFDSVSIVLLSCVILFGDRLRGFCLLLRGYSRFCGSLIGVLNNEESPYSLKVLECSWLD